MKGKKEDKLPAKVVKDAIDKMNEAREVLRSTKRTNKHGKQR